MSDVQFSSTLTYAYEPSPSPRASLPLPVKLTPSSSFLLHPNAPVAPLTRLSPLQVAKHAAAVTSNCLPRVLSSGGPRPRARCFGRLGIHRHRCRLQCPRAWIVRQPEGYRSDL
eukprot:scaffold92556_cov63-Phaeocystis_antarctica.AAC.3